MTGLTPYLLMAALFVCGWLCFASIRMAGEAGPAMQSARFAHNNLVLVTSAPVDLVQASLIDHMCRGRAPGNGATMWVRVANPQRVVYEPISTRTARGEEERFTAVITFQHLGPKELRAVASIDQWPGKGGVIDPAGGQAIPEFMSSVVAAFQSVDPMVQVYR